MYDLVLVNEATEDSVKYERIKHFKTGVGPDWANTQWNDFDPANDPDEDPVVETERETIIESMDGVDDGQYYIFYKIPQAGGRKRSSRRA
jgi:hypothetical protein